MNERPTEIIRTIYGSWAIVERFGDGFPLILEHHRWRWLCVVRRWWVELWLEGDRDA